MPATAQLPHSAQIHAENWDAHDLLEWYEEHRQEEAVAPKEENSLEQCVFRARELIAESDSQTGLLPNSDLFPTQLEAVDRLLCGGFARCEMVEVIGRRSSGRFSLVLSTLAAATQRGESVALVDLGDHFDPQAAELAGIQLERLLWLRPRHLKQTLGAAELLLGTGFPLVVLDLGTPPVPGGCGVEASWLRVSRAAQTHRGALLVSTPYRMSGTAARAVLQMGHSQRARARIGQRTGQWLGQSKQPRLLEGLETELELRKSRGRLKRRTPRPQLGAPEQNAIEQQNTRAQIGLRAKNFVARSSYQHPAHTTRDDPLAEKELRHAG